jgi:ribulose-5-phosphate 4-epimerase/fuculose-1-phosphate aldolase
VSASIDIAPDVAGLRLARVELAAAFRAAALHGFNEGIDNHFSLVVPGRPDAFLLNPYGPHWSELRASDLLTIGLDGTRLSGEGELDSTAFTIHLGAHRARPDAACVLHTHMPYATALAMTEGGLDTRASQNAMYFHGRVARLAYGGLAEAEEEGARIATALADGITIILMSRWPTPGTSCTSSSAPARRRCSRSRRARRCCRFPRRSRSTPPCSSAARVVSRGCSPRCDAS